VYSSAVLLGAIDREYSLTPGDGADSRFALANKSSVFHFSKPEAVNNLVLGFSEGHKFSSFKERAKVESFPASPD
jgi:hypothetical protein